MKCPISVTIASIIYFIFSALYCFLYVTFAIYTPDQFLQNLADAYSFLPSWLSIIVSVGFAAMPVFIAVGLLSGKKLARWIAVLSTVISLIMIFVDSELYSNGKIITQCIIQGILMFLLFNPAANRYFLVNK